MTITAYVRGKICAGITSSGGIGLIATPTCILAAPLVEVCLVNAPSNHCHITEI
jgi:hypothetical protein